MPSLVTTMVFLIFFDIILLGSNSMILKSKLPKFKIKRVEPKDKILALTRDQCPTTYPSNLNSFMTLVDSSTNGYGMVSSVTRPIDVSSQGNWLFSYRQFAGVETNYGQLGAAYSEDGLDWSILYNINDNSNPWGGSLGQARYPSSISTLSYPYVFWTEYANQGLGYGGRPFYSYDEFGWNGESWVYPQDVDLLFSDDKDFLIGSVGHGFDYNSNEQHFSVVYDDVTRLGNYLFTSQAIEGGEIIFGEEILIFEPSLIGIDGYSSSPVLSMNDQGQGLIGINGIFAGVNIETGTCRPPASDLTCHKVPIFKLSDDFGQSWFGDSTLQSGYYFTPDEVFSDILSSWPSTEIDPCTGEIYFINDYWSWYEFDMRVDQNGNPHIAITIIAESDSYFHFLDGYTGLYHLTIDRNYLSNPGPINSLTGWNWSFVPIPVNNSFIWNRPDGYSYLYGAMVQLSLSSNTDGIIYVVSNIAEQGEMNSVYDMDENGIIDDPCNFFSSQYDLYPNWSEDIWGAKSIDNGSTWTNIENLTQTPRDIFLSDCPPEEQYVHTAHWSDDNIVKYVYQQPDWLFNELGDPLGIDHKNRLFVGYSFIENGCINIAGDSNIDGSVNIFDLVLIVNEILNENALTECGLSAADYNEDGLINLIDIVSIVEYILYNNR